MLQSDILKYKKSGLLAKLLNSENGKELGQKLYNLQMEWSMRCQIYFSCQTFASSNKQSKRKNLMKKPSYQYFFCNGRT